MTPTEATDAIERLEKLLKLLVSEVQAMRKGVASVSGQVINQEALLYAIMARFDE